MRISSTLFFQTGLNSINAQQSDLMHIYQQIGSGKRMVTPADDPLAAAQAINIRQSLSMSERFAKNRDVANQNLGIEDNTLDSVNRLLQNLKTELVYAGNGTLSDADRATLGNVLSNARNNLLGLVNTTDGSGQYLFSGARGNTAPYQTDVDGSIVYRGDAGQRKIQADQTRQIAGSDVGSDIFNRAAPGTTSYLTSATATNGGTGVISTPMIMDPKGADVGKTFGVTFDSPNPLVAPSYQYTVTATDALGNETETQGTYVAGTTASLTLGNGVQANFSGVPVPGDSFVVEPASSPDYAASVVTVGANATISSPEVSDYSKLRPGDEYQIKFEADGTYTVTVTNLNFPAETYAAQKFVQGRENILQLPHGMQVKISGTPATDDTFQVKASSVTTKTDLNIFETLDSIIASLEKPLLTDQDKAAFQNTLNTAMQRLDVNYNNVLTVRSSVGARMNELDGLKDNGIMRSLGYNGQLSKMEDVDYYSASTQLTLRTSALEAAAMAFRKIQATSLFNMGQ